MGRDFFHPSVKVHIFVTDAFGLKLELGVITDKKPIGLFEKWMLKVVLHFR